MKGTKLLSLFLLFILNGSCDQKTETIYNFGDESDINDVLNSILDAASKTRYDEGLPGDWVALEKTQEVPGGSTTIVGYDDYSVLERNETNSDVTIRFLKEAFDAERVKIDNVAYDIVLQRASSLSKVHSNSLLKPFAKTAVQTQNTTEWYNVKRYKDQLNAPREIAQNPNCSGIPKCKIDVEVVEFDMVTKNEDDEPNIVNYKIYFSNQIPGYWATDVLGLALGSPAFPGHTKACLKTILDQDGRDQPVELCESIVNFLPLPSP